MRFDKYHATGNDFVLLDGSLLARPLSAKDVQNLCDRHRGIGADGLIILSKTATADFEMSYYNADGFPGSFCANGARCAAAWAYRNQWIGREATLAAIDGQHRVVVMDIDWIRVSLADVEVPLPDAHGVLVHTGSPHWVLWADDLAQLDVVTEGKKWRNNPRFQPDGVNVNFICRKNDMLSVRTYERGVEDETLSCGTGVVAAALVDAALRQLQETSQTLVQTRGGQLVVYFQPVAPQRFVNIWLEGPAKHVFKGEFFL